MYITLDDLITFALFCMTVFGTGVTLGINVGLFIAYVTYKQKEK